jgi:tetratricopeptide (TPR) repeat protein
MHRFLGRVGRAPAFVFLVAAALAVASPAIAQSSDRETRLNELFAQLKHCSNESQAAGIEQEIWDIWRRSGDASVDSLFDLGLVAMGFRDYDRALEILTTVTDRAPEFAEGWNKLASVRYLRGEYDDALVDVARTLEIERRHFGAITGRAMILLTTGENAAALRAFEQALVLNPNSRQIRDHVARLKAKLGYRSV